MLKKFQLLCILGFALIIQTGCEPTITEDQPIIPEEEIQPFQETIISETLSQLVFSNRLKGDPISPNVKNYAKALQLWIDKNPTKRIVTLLGVPYFGNDIGIESLWIISEPNTEGQEPKKQRALQLDAPTQLPPTYKIATLLFANSKPSGILAVEH